MRLDKNNEAVVAIRKNERLRKLLLDHVSGVRQHEMEVLASAPKDIGDMRFMQGRIAALADLMKLLDQ